MKPFPNEKKQQEDTLRGCMWRSEMLHKLKLHHHHDKIKGLWCIVKLTDEFNFSELLYLTIKILMRFIFLGSLKAHHLHTFYVLWLEQKCLIMRSIKCCVWWKTHCTIQFVIHHCFIVVSFCWVIAATRKIKLSMNITQNHGFAIRVWTMVWHRLSVKIFDNIRKKVGLELSYKKSVIIIC